MRKRGLTWLIVLAAFILLVVLAVILWPWVRVWLPYSGLLEAWIRYLTVDLDIGRWGPVVTLLLVGLIELVWALNLGRTSDSFDRRWDRLERVHAKETEVLNQEIALLKDERRALRAELKLREDLIREEKARLWALFEDLQRTSDLPYHRASSSLDFGQTILVSKSLAPSAPELSPATRNEWRQIVSQLERIEMIGSVTARKGQSAMQMQQHADELLRLGNACYQLGHNERALTHYDRALELMPSHSEALINRAVVKQDLGRYQSALHDLEGALKVGESPWIYLYRAVVQEELGEIRRALENYSRAIRMDSDLVEAYYRRGLLCARTGEYERAVQDETRVLEFEADHAGAYTVRGMAQAAIGHIHEALVDLDKACLLAPQFPEAFYERGSARQQLGWLEEALADFDRSIEADPTFSHAYMARGETLALMGDPWQAIASYDRLLQLEPKSAVAYDARGQARMTAEEYKQAIDDFDQALELEPGLIRALAHRGAAYQQLGEHERAIEDLDRAVALDANLAMAYHVRGLAYGSKGDYDKASRDLNRAVELDPSLASAELGGLGEFGVP
jgi:tetratricopeptide (TPR) repeat protein